MKLPVVWMSEAAAELRQARAGYDDIRPDVGERFAVAAEAIAQRPLQFPVVHRGRRRAGVRRFPYGIFFEVQENRIVVSPASTPSAIRGGGDRDKVRVGGASVEVSV